MIRNEKDEIDGKSSIAEKITCETLLTMNSIVADPSSPEYLTLVERPGKSLLKSRNKS